jgi:hypothetical protein
MRRSKLQRYSITSSARASRVAGTVRPSAAAVFKLMMRSNLTACWIGKIPRPRAANDLNDVATSGSPRSQGAARPSFSGAELL